MKKYAIGGLLEGPSHEEGGIPLLAEGGGPVVEQEAGVIGNSPANFPQENPAIEDANKMGQELESISLQSVEPEFPISNAMERMQVFREEEDV